MAASAFISVAQATITDVAGLSVATGDRSIVVVHPGKIVEIEEHEARRLIERRFAEAVK